MSILTIKVLAKQVGSPIVDAGPDITQRLPENSVNIIGSAYNQNGDVLDVTWTQISGPTVILDTPNMPILQIRNLPSASFTFKLTATDSLGLVGTDTMNLNVLAANALPTVDAGPDRVITFEDGPEIVQLNGSAIPGDGTIESYEWIIVTKPIGSVIRFDNDDNTIPNALLVDIDVVGTYTLKLQVTDDRGEVGSDTMTIVANPKTEFAPIINTIGPLMNSVGGFIGNMPGLVNIKDQTFPFEFEVSVTDPSATEMTVTTTIIALSETGSPTIVTDTQTVHSNGSVVVKIPNITSGTSYNPKRYMVEVHVVNELSLSASRNYRLDVYDASKGDVPNGGLPTQQDTQPVVVNNCYTKYQGKFTVPAGETGSLDLTIIDGSIYSSLNTELVDVPAGIYSWNVLLNNSGVPLLETTVRLDSNLSGGLSGSLTMERTQQQSVNFDKQPCNP